MTSLIGQTIGKYRLQASLGVGGMAQVYRAIQMPLERSVAVKVMHPHLTKQESLQERFLREAKAIAALQHPNIVQIYDFDFVDEVCYMAMEFLDGQTLDEQLQALAAQNGQPTPLPLPEALQVVIKVVEALDFAHRQGVIHRDVKPANIMRTADGRIVLADFGISTLLHETRFTVEGTTSGTPSYMSPEQGLGERGDARSDIYSLGAVLYQLVTGQLPFEADTVYGLIMQHINDPPPPASRANPELPAAVDLIISRAMEKKPAHRYQTGREFAAALQALLDGETDRPELATRRMAETTQTFATPAKSRTRYLWLALAAGLLVVLILARVLGAPAAGESQTLPATSQGVNSMAAKSSEDGLDSMAANSLDGVDSMAAPAANRPLVEDFSSNDLGWRTSDGPISRRVVDGAYRVTVAASNKAIDASPEQGGPYYDDFAFEAEATLLEGQPQSGYGLVFRRQDERNYYVFGINGQQQWSIWRLEDSAWQELRRLPDEVRWTFSEAVLPAGQLNRLKVEADGPQFRLYANDRLLGRVEDKAFAGGGIGFYVATTEGVANPLARVEFDNVRLDPVERSTAPSTTSDSSGE